ncbi:MAG: HD-GYP domain-containing protein [Thermodesulfobacteriota bacterium]
MNSKTSAAASSKSERPTSVADVSKDENYFPISPDTLNPDALTDFQVYLRRNGRYVLFTRERQYFSESLKQRLVDNDIHTVYIPYHQQAGYESYLFDNLEWILKDPQIPVEVRSRVFLDTTAKQVNAIFENNLPALNEQLLASVQHVVGASLSFLSSPRAMENIGRFISHDYETFTHSVHVFTYTMMLMRALSENDDACSEQAMVDVGVGALLHDIGKMRIPGSILNKPGALNAEEWEMIKGHPVQGMRMCTNVCLPQASLNCIVFHHEKYDGSGYPAGMAGGEIPLPVRIITCCDVYDALTSNRAYASARSAFDALKIMSEEMKGAFDPAVFKSFIKILGNTAE